jgi:phage terminase large subunit
MQSRVPELLIAGPAGTGKSRACLEKMHHMCLLNPGMRALIVRKTLTSLGSTALVTYREHVAKESIAMGHVSFYGGSSQESAQYRYTNGSSIVVGGMDRATRVMSAEYDLIYVQEATELNEEDWEALLTRLRNGVVSFQQLIADCNPSTPTHWLKARADRGQVLMLNSQHAENPRYFTDDGVLTEQGKQYMANLDALTGVRRMRLRDGQWSAAEGIIYESWNPAVHLVDNAPIPAAWPRYWAIDWGYTNPFVLQCWAEDPDGRLVLYREIYQTQRTVDVHAAEIMSIVAPGGEWIEPKPTWIVADHDPGDRAVFTEATGLNTVKADKRVTEGIQAVQRRFALRPDGTAPLTMMRDSVVRRDPALVDAKKPASTIEEIPGYVWDTGAGAAIKETPLKIGDHGADAMRYLVMQKDLGRRTRIDRVISW